MKQTKALRGAREVYGGELGCLHGVARGKRCSGCDAEDRAMWRRLGVTMVLRRSGELVPYSDRELSERAACVEQALEKKRQTPPCAI